jgi:hypothetical protein
MFNQTAPLAQGTAHTHVTHHVSHIQHPKPVLATNKQVVPNGKRTIANIILLVLYNMHHQERQDDQSGSIGNLGQQFST